MTYPEACSQVAKKYDLGKTLVTGHRDKYWSEAAELYVNSAIEEAVKEKEKPVNGQYKFYKSSRAGMADVFHNGSYIGLWPYYIAFELCNASNSHYDLISKLSEKEKEIEELKAEIKNWKETLTQARKLNPFDKEKEPVPTIGNRPHPIKPVYEYTSQKGTPGHCYAGQIFKNGKAFVFMEPTENADETNATGKLITEFLNGELRVEEEKNGSNEKKLFETLKKVSQVLELCSNNQLAINEREDAIEHLTESVAYALDQYVKVKGKVGDTEKTVWISVKEAKPEDGQKCIVYSHLPWKRGETTGVYSSIHILTFRIDDGELSWDQEDGDDHYCEFNRVSHWMPLPDVTNLNT